MKDREFRYQSAFGLAEDLRRHLKGEAISAKPTSVSYQARVFARKNKAVVGLATFAVALLVVGIVWTSKLYVDVSAQRTLAEASAEQAIAANQFLVSTLESVVPPGFGDVRTIGDLCDRVSQDIDGAFPDSPTTEADIRHTIGQIYMSLDKRDQSEQQLRKAYQLREKTLGDRHEMTLRALDDLNTYYFVFGPSEAFLETAWDLYATQVDMNGPDHENALYARLNWIDGLVFDGQYDKAEQMTAELRETFVSKWGENSRETLFLLREHALRQMAAGMVETARMTGHQAYLLDEKLATSGTGTSRTTKNIYASTLVASGDLEAAKELYGHRKAPEPLGIDMEYQGSQAGTGQAVQVLVFFETWCPYSQRYIPKVESLNQQYRDLGVDVIGLTEVSRSASDKSVRKFIVDNGLTFSVLKETGRCSNYFDISGVPQTVILHDGEVIWESPGSGWLNRHMLEGIVNVQ